VTPALFARYPDARALAAATVDALEQDIRSTGFFRQKARALVGIATALVERHGGDVPASMEALTALPGVGRKTANVVLGHALGVPGLPVDRHVLRVANRLGLTRSDDAVQIESDLTALYPPARWTQVSDLLILHGRRICRPSRPACDLCNARRDCDFFSTGGAITKAAREVRRSAVTRAKPAAPRTTTRATPRASRTAPGDRETNRRRKRR
jgi:endonuclease-3